MRRIGMMIHHKVTPVVVLDGSYLPAKALKEEERLAGSLDT